LKWDNGAGDNNFYAAANWDLDTAPSSANIASDQLTIEFGTPITALDLSSNDGGTLVVTNAGTIVTVGKLFVGRLSGSASMEVSSGAVLNNTNSVIGDAAGTEGSVSISGEGSAWNSSNIIYIGRSGSAEVNITEGGAASVNGGFTAYIGYNAGGVGAVNVSGEGSSFTAGASILVGRVGGGTGSLTVTDGAVVSAGSYIKVGAAGSSVTLDGGTLVANAMQNTDGGAFNFVSGRIHTHYFYGDLTNTSGTIATDGEIATTAFHGNYTQGADGVIELMIEALDSFDVFSVEDGYSATLDGTLRVLLGDSFTPVVGDSFQLLDIGSLEGAFAAVELPDLSGGLAWDLGELYSTGTIAVVPEPASLLMMCITAALARPRRRGSMG
jgi:T5SS/PEP-CTERM-associated repeat protein